jgi:hypothetical protein
VRPVLADADFEGQVRAAGATGGSFAAHGLSGLRPMSATRAAPTTRSNHD